MEYVSGSAQLCATLMDFLLDTHPGLVEAIGVPMVLDVLLLLCLLELVPQPLYPVMVTGSHLTAERGRKRR